MKVTYTALAAVGADEIVAFAKQFDPQTLHTDPEAAKNGPFGGPADGTPPAS